MSTIKIDQIIPGVDHRVWELPKKLTTAGIEVPPALTTGLARARWRLSLPDDEPAKARMAKATTEEEFQAAALELAEVSSTRTTMAQQGFRNLVDGYRLAAVDHAVRDCAHGLLSAAVDGYNHAVPAFSAALQDVPDLSGVRSAYDVDAAGAQALTDAKATAGRLNVLLGIYCDVANLAGYSYTAAPKQDNVSGALGLMTVLGSWKSGSAMERAASDVREYSAGHGNHGALSPHCVVAWAVDRGEADEYLMVLPDEAEERRHVDYTAGPAPDME